MKKYVLVNILLILSVMSSIKFLCSKRPLALTQAGNPDKGTEKLKTLAQAKTRRRTERQGRDIFLRFMHAASAPLHLYVKPFQV